MPTNKDLKRLIRSRMRKTGEAYTTARSQLHRSTNNRQLTARSGRRDYSTLAGMSDDAVRSATGYSWQQWVQALDAIQAASRSHRDIAKHVRDHFGTSSWWSQTVTVGYERIKGIREIGQRPGGTYESNKSRTLPVPVSKLYRAFSVSRTRNRWLPGVKLKIRTAIPDRSMRITWEDGTSVQVHFVSKGTAKSQVAVQHGPFPKKSDMEHAKAYWADRLHALTDVLTPAQGNKQVV